MVHTPMRASEYRERAAAATAAGLTASLGEVRAKHERAARVWAELADAEDARLADRNARLAEVARKSVVAPQ